MTDYDFPRYRRLRDGVELDAVRYGNADGSWDAEAVTRVAKFLLGVDVNTRMRATNEQMLDIVRPDLKRWNLDKGVADVDVVDPRTGIAYRLALGDWVVRIEDGSFIYVESAAFAQEYAIPSDFETLANFIYENFPWEGETYQAVAESVAAKLIWAGWHK